MSFNLFICRFYTIITYLLRYLMKELKIFTFVLVVLVFQAYSIRQIRKCQYIPLGKVNNPDNSYAYTIKRAWTKQTYTRKLKSLEYLSVEGFQDYSEPHDFFTAIFGNGNIARSQELQLIGDVKSSSQNHIQIRQQDFRFAYGNETFSDAKLYKVPYGKSLITVRFQLPSSNPFENAKGLYTAVVDVVDNKDLHRALQILQSDFSITARETKLRIHDVTSSLNIVPQFTAGSILRFQSKKDSQPIGTTRAVIYEAFIVVIGENQTVLAGSIYKGQPGVIQSYHHPTHSCISYKLAEENLEM